MPKSRILELPADVLADIAGVSARTARRWRERADLPEPARRAVAALHFGELGAIDERWRLWRLEAAELRGPDGAAVSLGDVRALPYLRQQLAHYQARERLGGLQADWLDGQFR